MSRRLERVKIELKKEISKILHDDLKDPRIGFITVTRIDLTPDLRNAKSILVSLEMIQIGIHV